MTPCINFNNIWKRMVASRSGHFTPGKETSLRLGRGWVGPRACANLVTQTNRPLHIPAPTGNRTANVRPMVKEADVFPMTPPPSHFRRVLCNLLNMLQ
jgi:hypothetical protein